MKTLEELNLVDDFLVNSLTSHKIYGEQSARYILECILHRQIGKLTVVPQRFFCGENTETHGIRLDVYLDEENGEIFDIEPDQNDGKEEIVSLPRRVRFYHAKIDAGNLTAGDTYGSLRNVIVIFITTYDPFGLNRMVYTIKNRCIEVPELEYEDGAQTIFLYTRGSEGNPPEELKQLLHYMEHSSIENASTESLKKLHRMVTAVKRDGEVGLAYMKSFEREERIRKQGEEEGEIVGKTKEVIKLGRRFGKSENEILLLLQEELQIDKDKAEDFLKKYFAEKGFSKVVCYGMGDGLDAVREAAAAEKNIVVSPAGIAAAKYLQQKFGTPYELFCPPEIIPEWKEKKEQVAGLLNVEELSEKKILIVHQQVLANTLREEFISANINVASWFMMNKEQKKEQDILFKEEDDWITYIKENEYDIIIADPLLKKAVPFYKGEWYDLPHFAISGKKRQSV